METRIMKNYIDVTKLENILTNFGPMNGLKVIEELVKCVGADSIREAIDEIDNQLNLNARNLFYLERPLR